MKKFLITMALCCTATGAAAELTYGSAFLNYHKVDTDEGNIDLTTFRGIIEYRANAFTLSGEIGGIDIEDEDLRYYSLGAGYTLNNGVTLGLDHVNFDSDGEDTNFTSGYAMFGFGSYTLGVSVGDSSDLDDTVYGVFGAWDVNESGTVGADVYKVDDETLVSAYADYDLAQYSLRAELTSFDDVNIFSLEGSYDLGNRFAVIGGVTTVDADGDGINTLEVGAAYALSPAANLEVALARTDVDGGEDFNRMTVGVNYEFGKRTSKRRTLGNILTNTAGSLVGLTDF